MPSMLALASPVEKLNKIMDYTLRISRRARRVRLAVYSDGRVVVISPRRLSEQIVRRFVVQKRQWIIDKQEYFKKNPQLLASRGTTQDFATYKEAARALAHERINYFNQIYNFKVGRISIRNQRTRWGSCSRQGNLNFNYKIARLPLSLADYIIVHELCHLKEFNHSPKFWNLMAKTIPDYAARRRELKKNGLAL